MPISASGSLRRWDTCITATWPPISASRGHCDVTGVSILVNPTQFGPNEGLSRYPRDFARDEALCRSAEVSIIFAPSAEEIYPAQFESFVEPGQLAKPLRGAFRPGHFRGVSTVVCKLFNMVQPDVAYFEQKDFQQCAVIRRMLADLNFPIEIVTVPIVRESDGLAMSSRNRYLSPQERGRTLAISGGLFATAQSLPQGSAMRQP
ncbi:pantoate--beta-alanine ligase [Bradyrhizobium sp. Gha]|nr:pantoate--beta-alanine ligase [Bradyrhizobium sp. Gha]